MATNSCQTTAGNQVIGRGKVFLDVYRKGVYEGERYLGNTPSFSLSSSADKLDHYNSDSGLREKDKSITLENGRTGSLEVDDISLENVALMFAGQVYSGISSAQKNVFERVNGGNPITKNRVYQLGVTDEFPQGRGSIDPATFTIGYADASIAISGGDGDISSITGVTALPHENFELDTTTGRLYIESDAPAINGSVQLVVKYDRVAYSQDLIISSDDSIEGALRFVSDNPEGEQMSYYLPKVSIAPDGDYALKGDDWQVMSFTFDVLKRDCKTKRVYAYRNPITAATAGPVTYNIQLVTQNQDGNNISTVKAGDTGNLYATVTTSDGGLAAGRVVQFSATGALLSDPTAMQTDNMGRVIAKFSIAPDATQGGVAQFTAQVVGTDATARSTLTVVAA